MTYCTNCGTQIHQAQNYCAGCGALAGGGIPTPQLPAQPVPASGGVGAQTGSDATLQKLARLKAESPPAATSSGKKVLIAIFAVILLGGVAAVGGVVYIGYRIKQRASVALNKLGGTDDGSGDKQKVTSDDLDRNHSGGSNNDGKSGGGRDKGDNPLAGLLGALGGNGGQSTPMGNLAKGILEDAGVKNPDMPADLIRNIPYSALTNPLPCPQGGGQINVAGMAAGKIQLKPETVLTTSWSVPAGDLESTDQITSVTPGEFDFQDSGPTRPRVGEQGKIGHAVLANRVCSKDIAEADTFSTGWVFNPEDKAPGIYPGVSRTVLSLKKFQTLKASGTLPMVFGYYDYMDALTEWELLAWKGTLNRVEPGDVPFPLIINDQPVDVPAIHVQGSMKVIETGGRFGARDQPADAYILDDPATPVILSWMFGENLKQDDAFRVRYTKVTYPSAGKPTIEQQLAKQRKAITYGIYFDFNQDTIKPESEPVLKEIAQAIADRPDWKLTVAGYTDNIGGDKYNLDLSQRRSSSVKRALLERYHVDGSRLSTAGYGDSSPIDTNETLEGRARNRRVELTLD
jgi:outer membrane protein OmpA-like peptidoglycan-associated protein